MNPFAYLGVPDNCPIDIAKAAYRKLAQQHHPDKGGDAERFKEISTAWDKIDKGFKVKEEKQPASSNSFGATSPRSDSYFREAFKNAKPEKPRGTTAEKPAPGYEARRQPPPMPRTKSGRDKHDLHLLIELTQDQAFEGCTIPFIHNGMVHEYVARPGITPRTEDAVYPLDERIGGLPGQFHVTIEIRILKAYSAPEEKPRDAEMTVPLCALGLFIGGRISLQDHLGEKFSIDIQPGCDPTKDIKIPNRGYGVPGARGTLIVKIAPVFKAPTDLNLNELRQLQRLNEMAKV